MQSSDSHPDIRQLVQQHHADVYRYAHRLCGNVTDAEDLTQQSFLLAHQKIDQLRDPQKSRPWLLAIVRTCFLKAIRKRRPAHASDLDLELEHMVQTPPDSPVDSEALQNALDELPDEFRVVVLMHYFEFLSYREIAEQLELPAGTVMSRLARAKRRLRRQLTKAETGEQGAPSGTATGWERAPSVPDQQLQTPI